MTQVKIDAGVALQEAQALRDLPSTATDPTAVVWPEPPNTI